jgi:hypothetical protein
MSQLKAKKPRITPYFSKTTKTYAPLRNQPGQIRKNLSKGQIKLLWPINGVPFACDFFAFRLFSCLVTIAYLFLRVSCFLAAKNLMDFRTEMFVLGLIYALVWSRNGFLKIWDMWF